MGLKPLLITSPQGASPLAGEGENRPTPTMSEYIAFMDALLNPQTEAREHEES